MTYTENYALNQWSKTDRIQMSDFNADNSKIDAALKANADAISAETAARSAAVASKADTTALTAETNARTAAISQLSAQIANCGNCRIVTGTYTGTGTYGSSDKGNTLTFDGKPLLIFISGDVQLFAVYGAARAYGTGIEYPSSYGSIYITEWGRDHLSWYYDNSAKYQCNSNGVTYYYVALLQCN